MSEINHELFDFYVVMKRFFPMDISHKIFSRFSTDLNVYYMYSMAQYFSLARSLISYSAAHLSFLRAPTLPVVNKLYRRIDNLFYF